MIWKERERETEDNEDRWREINRLYGKEREREIEEIKGER